MDRIIMMAMCIIFTLTVSVALIKRVDEATKRTHAAVECSIQGKLLNKEGVCTASIH